MANPNVRKQIEKISNEADRLVEHVVQHSGISPKDAMFVDNVASAVCEAMARLAAEARSIQRDRSSQTLVRDVRKALGYTYP